MLESVPGTNQYRAMRVSSSGKLCEPLMGIKLSDWPIKSQMLYLLCQDYFQ